MSQTKYTPEEIGRIGTEIYRQQLRSQVMPHAKGKFLILDIESGDYEIDADDTSAEERLHIPEIFNVATAYVDANVEAGRASRSLLSSSNQLSRGPGARKPLRRSRTPS